MKHKDFIQHFINVKDEFDGDCYIIWLPAFPGGGVFNNVLPGTRTDILAAYMNINDGNRLTFLTSSPDDRDQYFAGLCELPVGVRKKLISYIKNL